MDKNEEMNRRLEPAHITMQDGFRTLAFHSGVSVVDAGKYADQHIEQVVFPASVRKISQETFKGWADLKRVEFSPGCHLETIEVGAFQNSGLEEFTAPALLERIMPLAFAGCKGLKCVELNEGLESLGSDAYDDQTPLAGVFQGSAVESVKLPSTLRRLGFGTFKDCKSLKRVELPEQLEKIGSHCFDGSGVESVQVSMNACEINKDAFDGCESMKTLEIAPGTKKVVRSQLP